MKFVRYYFGVCLFCVLAGFGLIHMANGSGTAADGAKSSDAKSDSGMSVGTILMWWGSRDAIPAGWEICDGQLAKSAGATLAGKKPDLTDRFPKGATATRKNISDLAQAMGGNNNMPALKIAKIDGLKVSEDGAHTHSPLQQAAEKSKDIDQATGQAIEETVVVRTKIDAKQSKSNEEETADTSEGNHSHARSGFVGSEKGFNADGEDNTGANQPAYSELFFIIRVK